MKKAVMYGAGNIGRGFIGQVFANSGYEVVYLDIVPEIVAAMNEKRSYTVRVVSNEGNEDQTVKNVRAVSSITPEAVDEIASADIMATAVGVNIMPKVAPVLAAGISKRIAQGGGKLNIILAENQLNADLIMRGMIYERLSEEEKSWAEENLGLIEASIGRMVPRMTPEQRAGDPLLICVEAYCELPVDRDAFKGEIPDLAGLVPFSPFGFYIKRKLFLHNMGHAILAYLGYLRGYEYIWQAAEDKELFAKTSACMEASAQALFTEYGVPIAAILANVDDLLMRFRNRALGDTVARVGGDPVRKLRRDDRLVGAALYIEEHGGDISPIVNAITAALKFDPAGDPTAPALQTDLKEKGIDYVLSHYMGLSPDERLYGEIKAAVK